MMIEKYKSGIHIKKKNRGKFTSYCGGKVTSACIAKGKNSSNPAIRKRATFADNARHFKHRSGGLIVMILKLLKAGTINMLDNKGLDRKNYLLWLKLSPTLKFKRRINIAKALFNLSSSPIYNSLKAIFGGYDPENPDLIYGDVPTPGMRNPKLIINTILKSKNIIERASRISDKIWDKHYLKLINKGDIKRVLLIRDLHFKTKTKINNPYLFQHATNYKFNLFNLNKTGLNENLSLRNGKGVFLTLYTKNITPELATSISDLYGKNIMPLRAYFKNPEKTLNAFYFMKDNSSDGYMYNGNLFSGEAFIRNPKLLKSAYSITYDDAGNIIPISLRDNFLINDIRYKQGGTIKTANARKWKHQEGGVLNIKDDKYRKYKESLELSFFDKIKRNVNRAKARFTSGPNIGNILGAIGELFYSPQDPNILVGEPAILPGYLIKPLILGNQLVKQLSKANTISTNAVKALANKSGKFEGPLMLKVIDTKFPGLRVVDYDKYRQAILAELIPYEVHPATPYAEYGLDRLGYYTKPELENMVMDPITRLFTANTVLANTFTFSSPRLPQGEAKHYFSNTLGHTRTFTNPLEAQVLNVMESQSDWALSPDNVQAYVKQASKAKHRIELLKEHIALLKKNLAKPRPQYEKKAIQDLIDTLEQRIVRHSQYLDVPGEHVRHLQDTYMPRQLQENMLYASRNGYTSMRYPTRETAIKVEGFEPTLLFGGDMNKEKQVQEMRDRITMLEFLLSNETNPRMYKAVAKELENLKQQYNVFRAQSTGSYYSPQEEGILRKYEDFPKMFERLFKDINIGKVTDTKGNTWYQFRIPKDMQSRELLYKNGGKI